MLGILLIYFIWKYFNELAFDYDKPNRWIYSVLGIVVYYAGTFLGGIIIGLISIYILEKDIDQVNDILLNLISIPFGMGTCWLFYFLLKKQWEKSKRPIDSDILDQNF